MLLAPLLGFAPGCAGISQNPSYFPYWLPTGDLVHTHAKPIGPGYYADFDPHAVELAVQPTVATSQVGTQVVLLATVRDAAGVPQRDRRIEWMVTGGTVVEVDESGVFSGRGGSDGRRAFSFTSSCEHRLTRGNAAKEDDVMIRPGQSWCVVTAPEEGDTHVQVMAPGIANWDKRIKTAVIRWVDATWDFPPKAAAKMGSTQEFVTRVVRASDRKPLAKYRVRYSIIDGPPAFLLPSRTQEEFAVTDLDGLAKVRITQLNPLPGTNRVRVEIIRPPDPTTPSGSGVSIQVVETAIQWQTADSPLGPPVLAPGVPLGPPVIAPAPGIQLGPPADSDIQWKRPGAAPNPPLGAPMVPPPPTLGTPTPIG